MDQPSRAHLSPGGKDKKSLAYHHGDLRAALLSAARTALEGGSSEAVSLNGLAKHLGVSQSAPYRHFATRESLLAALAAEGFAQFQVEVRKAALKVGSEPALQRCCLAYLAFSRRNPGLYKLMFASELLHMKGSRNEALQQSAGLAFHELLERVQSAVPNQTRATAVWIWMTMHGLAMTEIAGLALGPASQEMAAINVIEEMTERLNAYPPGSDNDLLPGKR